VKSIPGFIPPGAGGGPTGPTAPPSKRSSSGPSKKPPGLRGSDDPKRMCRNCAHFSGGECLKYSYSVSGSQLCDSWSSKGDKQKDKGKKAGPPSKEKPSSKGNFPPGMEQIQ
jgi:hypothetical protein